MLSFVHPISSEDASMPTSFPIEEVVSQSSLLECCSTDLSLINSEFFFLDLLIMALSNLKHLHNHNHQQ